MDVEGEVPLDGHLIVDAQALDQHPDGHLDGIPDELGADPLGRR